MSQELLYTSAPEGLNPGDQGFCTVVCTQGMPRNLKEVLESLSGYRQADQPPHPVNYSHVMHTIGGKRYQVLSRVSDYEKDYSGRTNKLAHHVALTLDDLPASGPAALLEAGLGQTRWDGQTRWEPQGPVLPIAEFYQGPCRHWEALAGDAGWAGVLAESAADGSNRPMYVIFAPGDEVLPLVIESLGRFAPRKSLDHILQHLLHQTARRRGLPVAVRVGRQPRSPTSPRCEPFAKNRPRRTPPKPAAGSRWKPLRPSRARRKNGGSQVPPPRRPRHSRPRLNPCCPPPRTLCPSNRSPPRLPIRLPAPPPLPPAPLANPRQNGQTSSKLPWILGGSAAVLFVGMVVLVYSMMTKDLPPVVAASETDRTKDRRRRSLPSETDIDFLSQREKARKELAAKEENLVTPKFGNTAAPKRLGPAVAQKPKTEYKDLGPWNRDILEKKRFLPLPSGPRRSHPWILNPWKSPKSPCTIPAGSI